MGCWSELGLLGVFRVGSGDSDVFRDHLLDLASVQEPELRGVYPGV